MKPLLIQQIYPNTEGVEMLKISEARSRAYCDLHGFDYWCVYDNPMLDIDRELLHIDPQKEYDHLKGSWGKVVLIKKAMSAGYEKIVWLDADTLIVDMTVNLCEAIQADKIGACWHRIPQLAHWNVGALYFDNTEETRGFIDEWLAFYPPPPDGWFEQGIFNRLARASKTIVTLSDKWNATLNVSMVPDAVVLGFHGSGTTKERIELMKQTMERLSPAQKA